MKSLRNIFIGLAVLGMVIFLSGLSFAEEGCNAGKTRHEAKIKLLKDSAVALQKTKPDLAKSLNDYVDRETKEIEAWKAKHEAKMKLIKDAAAALQQSNPDLAKGLLEMTEGKYRHEGAKELGSMVNEKEEVGETVEPKEEQGENTTH